jgi:signal peptidase I
MDDTTERDPVREHDPQDGSSSVVPPSDIDPYVVDHPPPGSEERSGFDTEPEDAGTEPEDDGAGEGSLFRWLLETLITIAAAVALALFLQAYVVKTYVVPTGSMVPTIHLEDRIISNRLAYRFGEPETGDVVVIENPSHEGPPLVKRVIATEGEQLDIREGLVYLDGEELDEPWVQPARRGKESLPEPVVVPEGDVWVMGDNRVGSSDSRVFGTLPADSIYGQAFFTYWPPRSFGVLE